MPKNLILFWTIHGFYDKNLFANISCSRSQILTYYLPYWNTILIETRARYHHVIIIPDNEAVRTYKRSKTFNRTQFSQVWVKVITHIKFLMVHLPRLHFIAKTYRFKSINGWKWEVGDLQIGLLPNCTERTKINRFLCCM